MLITRLWALSALTFVSLCAPAYATSTTVPPESFGRLLQPADAPPRPIALPDVDTVRRPLALQNTGRIAFVNVRVDLAHPDPSHLELRLISPSGTRVLLARGVAGVSGTFGDGLTPAEPLEALEGEEPWGTWVLEVTDTQRGSTGELRSWGLELQLQSRATLTRRSIQIPNDKVTFRVAGLNRRVYYAIPEGTPPASGWPVAWLFHGSLAPPWFFFRGRSWWPYNAYHQARLVKDLLDAGYVILAPEAKYFGTAWETSFTDTPQEYLTSKDHALMERLFHELVQGRFGYVDTARYYATGISSGGYMTSRMAVSYPGKFRALVVHGGAYATNWGPFANLPARMPAQHPPTAFLHGGRDFIVPIRTMRRYRDALQREGVPVRTVEDPRLGHVWLRQAPEETLGWFERY